MRPTLLNFRSPKESTPGPYDTRVRFDGSPLEYCKAKSPTFSREKRFKQYENEAKRTSSMIGPGSYSQLRITKIKGSCIYKPLHGLGINNEEEYIYVGHLLIKNPHYKNTRLTEQDSNGKFELSRPTTASDKLSGSPAKTVPRKSSLISRNISRYRLIHKDE